MTKRERRKLSLAKRIVAIQDKQDRGNWRDSYQLSGWVEDQAALGFELAVMIEQDSYLTKETADAR